MVFFAVYTFEDVRTWLAFFGGCLIEVLVLFAIPHFLSIVFGNMCSIALYASGHMRTTA